jgi:hypothetical protein
MIRKHLTIRRLLPVAAAVGAFAAAASTAAAMTISLGTPDLTGRVAITEPVTVTCTAFDQSLTLDSESVSLQVQQAAGRSIAHGSASSFSFLPTLLFPCDGSQTTVPVTVSADPTGPPFHGGPAVFTASAAASAATPCFPGSTTCFTSPVASQTASSGATALNLH